MFGDLQGVNSTAATKQVHEKKWRRLLPECCRITNTGDEFLQKELKLLDGCSETCGPAAVFYDGPTEREMEQGGNTMTKMRRKMMEIHLKKYHLAAVRQSLSMLSSGPDTRRLLITLDFFLKQYDEVVIYSTI